MFYLSIYLLLTTKAARQAVQGWVAVAAGRRHKVVADPAEAPPVAVGHAGVLGVEVEILGVGLGRRWQGLDVVWLVEEEILGVGLGRR